MQNLDKTLESLLFAAGEPLTIERLSKLTNASRGDIEVALNTLSKRLTNGVVLVQTQTTVALAIPSESAEVVHQMLGDPEDREIGQAGLEVLAIILYQGASSRSTIDYIRGVNSTSSIRTLLMRNLLERAKGESGREIVYQPTVELLEHLGITNKSELPDSEKLKNALSAFVARGTE